MPVPRGPKSHLWQPETRKSHPRSRGAAPRRRSRARRRRREEALRLAALRVALGDASAIARTGSLTPVLECTQVSATARVLGVDGVHERATIRVQRRTRGVVVEPHPSDGRTRRGRPQAQRLVRRVEVVLGREDLLARPERRRSRRAGRGPSSSSRSARSPPVRRRGSRRLPGAPQPRAAPPRPGCRRRCRRRDDRDAPRSPRAQAADGRRGGMRRAARGSGRARSSAGRPPRCPDRRPHRPSGPPRPTCNRRPPARRRPRAGRSGRGSLCGRASRRLPATTRCAGPG